jgi:PmbA protein
MRILEKLSAQAEQVEVVEVQGENTSVGFEANRLKSSQVEETKGIALRMVKGGRLGFAASSDLSAMDKLVDNLHESTAHGEEIPIVFPPLQEAAGVAVYDSTISHMPIPRLVEIGREAIDIVLQVEPEAQVNLNLERGVRRLTVRNQAGLDISFDRSPFSIFVEISRVQGDDVLMLWDVAGTTLWEEDYLAFARKAAEKLRLAQRSAHIRSGRMPVLFSPSGSLVLALPLMLGLDGKNVYTRTSPMAAKVGEKLFDSKLTVLDDPTLDGRFGSAPYDDEGVAHRRNVLIGGGELRGFVYDLRTAAQSGVDSTGNGSRSLFSPPSPSPTNFVVEGGGTPLAEMIAGIDEGLLADSALGLGQGNVLSGAFSNSLGLAYKIEKGEIVGRVKDVSIAGNVYDLLQDVAAVSRESEWIYNNFSLPYMLLDDMNVVAKE